MGTLFITVHGTGDAEAAPPGEEPKWWSPESPFARELLAAAPPGARVEPFLWSGANDELHRRRAGDDLYKRLREADGERIVLVGHSHGGSVIALALQFAAARGDGLDHVERWMTIGTPFIQMKRRLLPWERYDLLGQTALWFLLLLVIMGIGTLVTGDNGWFTPMIVVVSAAGALACALVLFVTQRKTQRLYSRRTAANFTRLFESRWRGVGSSHDEATNGLARLPSIKVSLFDSDLIAPGVRAFVGATFVVFVAIGWLSSVFFRLSAGIQSIPWLAASQDAHLRAVFSWLSLFANPLLGGGPVETILEPHLGQMGASIVAITLFALSALAIYLLLLFALLKLSDLIVRATIGLMLATGLNKSANEMILKRAYGNTTAGEQAVAARTSPFTSSAAHVLPAEANEPLLAFARAHAADTLAKLHDALFTNDDSKNDEPIVQAILERLSWRELIHTAYFKVPEARRYIVSRVLALD